MKCVGLAVGEWGDPPRPHQSPKEAQMLFPICGEHSCALPLLPYTSVLKNLAGKESGAVSVSASRACGTVVDVTLSLLHQEVVFSASESFCFLINLKASRSKSKLQQSV